MKLKDILQMLRDTYCRTIGAEYMYMADVPQKRWIQERLESSRATPGYDAAYKKHILERITAAETLERYLHTRYVGQTRFSLEGGDSLIPLLDNLLQRAGAVGVQELVIGMAHRGRLNVLVNTLGKMPKNLFAEFEGKQDESTLAGDVKYHDGFSSNVMTPGGPLHLSLAFNPSHLEIVNPVVEGSVRARQHRRRDKSGSQVLPVLIHGDASYAGQGVVMETLNLAQTRGFGTGGTVHIIINNQIGFTTSDLRDARSTLYCSDVSKMLEVPIFHVNGDDPEAVCFATEIALDYRMKFAKDVVIDLVCYRRLGHNEQDEPMVTQPLMYKRIHQHPTPRKIYGERLAAAGVLSDADAEDMVKTYRNALDGGFHTNKTILSNYKPPFEVNWKPFAGTRWNENDDTRLPLETLKELGRKIADVPPNFKLHPRVEKIMADRRLMAEGKLPLDWGMAENLAYATLLNEGYSVRISGQDVGRGTFFHRHAVLHDQNREKWDQGTHMPLQHISDKQGDFRRHRLGAVRGGGARFRIRLCDVRSERTGGVGGTVWRFRQRRAGRDRSVYRVGRDQVGPHVRADDDAAARLRRRGPRAFVRTYRTLSANVRRLQHAGLHAGNTGADVLSSAQADGASVPQTADYFFAEKPAAPQGIRFAAGGIRQR